MRRKDNKNHLLTIKINLLTFAYWYGCWYLLRIMPSSCEDISRMNREIHLCVFYCKSFGVASHFVFLFFVLHVTVLDHEDSFAWGLYLAVANAFFYRTRRARRENWIEIKIFLETLLAFKGALSTSSASWNALVSPPTISMLSLNKLTLRTELSRLSHLESNLNSYSRKMCSDKVKFLSNLYWLGAVGKKKPFNLLIVLVFKKKLSRRDENVVKKQLDSIQDGEK